MINDFYLFIAKPNVKYFNLQLHLFLPKSTLKAIYKNMKKALNEAKQSTSSREFSCSPFTTILNSFHALPRQI